MASRTQPNKVLLDIADCVAELKRQSDDGKTPINDDTAVLHRFEEKLELILLFGLIEKPGFLGPKKSYWNYICSCFSSSKRNHDGISFVKSVSALKTPLGCGRAFIRYCLVQKCLADTLQSCFMNQKISRDFYTDLSLPVQEKLWSSLVTSLYELNELNFDLHAGHTELDISWPKFARKLFSKLENEHRNSSNPDLNTFSAQDTFYVKEDSDSSSLDTCSNVNDLTINADVVKLTEVNAKLSQQNLSLQEEVERLQKEKLKLQCDITTLQAECQSLQQKISSSKDGTEEDNLALSAKEIVTDSNFASSQTSENIAPETGVNDSSETQLFSCLNSIKSKTSSDMQNSSKCALLQNNNEMTAQPALSSDIHNKDAVYSQISRNLCIPQNSIIYITELLLEIKTAIDDIEDAIQKCDVTLASPHICRLKRIRNCLEEKFSAEVDKSKSYSNFNNFVENCISCIKNFTSGQQDIINSLQEKIDLSIKQNQALYSKIKTLKNLLQSYGFLKVNEKEIEPDSVLLPLDAASASFKSSYEDFSCDIAHDPLLKRIIVPLLPILKISYSKLNSLNDKMNELQFGLDSSQDLNNHLISRVQDQEMHLKGVTKEIEEAQQIVSVLKKQHRKLQSAEGILKYDLQEKRKLLTRLKQQLENTREDFNLVRIKNTKSEAEWQDLHKEFTERHRQSSTENGFVDDKNFEEQETVFTDSSTDNSLSKECTSVKDLSNEDSAESSQLTKKNRLAMLEEQCQNLYSNLLQSSKKRQEIDKRLENISKTVEKNTEIHAHTFSSELPIESNFETVNDAEIETSEDNCQTIIFNNESFTSSHHSSSDVGSLNSECSSCIPSICNDANSPDSCFCDSSKADSCISVSPCKSHTNATQPLPISEQITEINSLHDSDCTSGSNSESKGDEMISSCESVELTANTVQHVPAQSISHVDSILLKKKDLEESLKNLEIDNGIGSPDEKKCTISERSDKEISVLEEERRHLLSQVQELERENLIISTQLHQTTQQLMLSKSTKEHEIAALQFQLNAEALKYERSLKEFSEQTEGLENMKKKVTEQEQLIFALEKALSEIFSDRESEKEQRWQELEDIQIALEAREQECITLCQELEKSMSEAEEEHSKNQILISQLEEFKAYNQRDKESMEAEILHLQQYSVELQKKLVKLLKEKDILWKRSDHLYNLQKTKIDDRWINDSEVSSCMACKSSFSFIFRKHHCRLCGRIFCHSCANNWLMTASSSKKIRACNECFMQHLEIKNVVRRGSDVPHIEDDSDGEAENNIADLSLIPGSSSFNSDVPSSINNSVLSLPIIQKQSTPHFSSAPDLRFVIKPNEITSCSSSLTEEKEENLPIADDNTNKDSEQNAEITSDECTSVTLSEDGLKSLSEEIKEENLPITGDNINKDSELNAGITSDECTSKTLTEDCQKPSRLKEILLSDMEECDISGKVAVHAGERVDLPIFCQTCPVELKWNFTSNCQITPFTVTFEDERYDNTSTVLYQTTDKMQDQMELLLSGHYVFHFVNSVRTTDLEVQYIFTVKHLE